MSVYLRMLAGAWQTVTDMFVQVKDLITAEKPACGGAIALQDSPLLVVMSQR